MKPRSLHLILPAIALCMTPATTRAAALQAYQGLQLDATNNAQLNVWDASAASGPQTSIELFTVFGGIVMDTYTQESAPGLCDGGINLLGSPVSIILQRRDPSGTFFPNDSLFTVGESETWGTAAPIFQVNGDNRETTFTDSDVAINSGSLKVDGNNVLTATSAASAGFIQTSSLKTALDGLSTAPASPVWQAAYVPRGTVSGGASLALGISSASGQYAVSLGQSTASGLQSFAAGSSSLASGSNAFAFGQTNTASGSWALSFGSNSTASSTHSVAQGANITASSLYTFASGLNSSATAPFAFARGSNATASGSFSMSCGLYTRANTYSEFVLGRYNNQSTTINAWNEEDALFRIGNGSSDTVRSDALTVQKNGKTTIVNKAWKTRAPGTPATSDPFPTTADSGGDALVVDGHTVLNGRVTIAATQGDISMGIYGN